MLKRTLVVLLMVLVSAALFSAPAAPQKFTKYYYLDYIGAKEFKYLATKLLPTIQFEVNEEFKLVTITDTQENINIFESVLKQLDEKVAQVQIESKIVETKLGTNEKNGVNWTWSDMLNGSTAEIKSFLEAFAPTDGRLQAKFGTLGTDGFTILMDYLLTRTDTDLLSSPKIVTLNGKEASINTGDQIPIKSSTNNAGIIVITTVFKETGVKLRVTPQIKQDNFILLDIHPEVSEVLQYSQITGDPIISVRKIDGSVIVKDNETLVVGGLLLNKTIAVESKLPILGDIPLLGLLFKSTSLEKDRTEIIIFLTPHIINEGEKLISPAEGIGR